MKVIKAASENEIAVAAARIFAEQIRKKPNSVLGFATGSSPIKTYERLIELYKKGELSFKDVSSFNLDEYCGLSRSDENSYFYFMHDKLFNHVDIKEENVHFLSGDAGEADLEGYRRQIESLGGIDIQLLGVGTNGHIGFNEPSDCFTDGPYVVRLAGSTIKANSRFFENSVVPEYAVTMGTGDIMRAKKIVLIATGASKAKAIKAMLEGDISPRCPASVLRMHPDVTVFIDGESAALLTEGS